MKRWLCFLLVALQILMLCACGQNEESTTTEATENSANTTSVPVETDSNVVEMAVAANNGTASEYSISDGNIYMIDVSNYDDPSQNKWSASITVGDNFDMNSLKYIGCCNEFLETVDVEIRCELLNSILTIESAGEVENTDQANHSLYLVLIAEGISEGDKVRIVTHTEDGAVETELRTIRSATGKVLYSERKNNFSDGLSWCSLTYVDTQKNVIAIVDKKGTILAEIRNSDYVSYGDFCNGVSLVKNSAEVMMFVDENGEVVFSADDPDYAGQIKGVYPGGYIFLERTNASLTSSATYYAIMDCYENFVIDWTEYGDYRLFNYLGGDVFAFLDGFKREDNDTAKFYNAETKVWTTVNNIDGGSLWRLPNLVAENSDGWVVLDSDDKGILVSTRDGEIITINSGCTFGIVADEKVVKLSLYREELQGLSYVDLNSQSISTIDYEYINLVEDPEWILEKLRSENHMEFGVYPSYNFGIPDASSIINTYLYDTEFSKGTMLLQLKGVDGYDYYALMNEQGENVIEPVKGIAVDTLGHGRFLVSRDDVYYILDESGHEVEILSGQDYGTLLSAEEYSDGLSWIETSRNVNAFIDTDGNYVFGEEDVLKQIKAIEVSSLTVSTELIEIVPIESTPGSETNDEFPGETPASAFKYEYGNAEIRDQNGDRDFVDAVVITKYIGNEDIVVIPAEIDGLPVLRIAESAFAGSQIKELYFSGPLSIIEAHAFAYCTELTTVDLPQNWMLLGNECFTGCTSLAELQLPVDCSFAAMGEVWNEELGVYEYVVGSPVSENDTTVVVTRAG